MPEQSLSLSDVVPQLRVDLKLSEPAAGAGDETLTVMDPTSGMSIGLRGFEMSIARMLNGRRTADEVIQAAAQVGLPLSLESLAGFIRKLRTLGWLVDGGAQQATPLDGSMWEPRAEWSEDVRRQFQTALKDARADRFGPAREVLEQLLAAQPELKEANELLSWVQERQDSARSGARLPTFTDLYAEVERGWFADGDRQSQANASAQAQLDSSGPGLPMPGRKAGNMKIVFIGVGVLVAAAIAALLIPFPYQASAAYELAPNAVTPVAIDRTGQLLKVAVAEGAWVDKGATLATWDAAGAKAQMQDVEGKLAAAQKKLTAASAPNKKAADAKKKLDKAAADEKKAAAALEKEKVKAKGKKTPALTKAEKKLASAEAAVAAQKKAFDAANVNPAKDAAEKDVAALTGLLQSSKAQSEAPPLTAPAAGTVMGLAAKDGATVQAGTPFCRLEDTRTLRVKLTPKGDDALKAGQRATLTIDGKPVKANIEKLAGKNAESSLDNAKGAYKSGTKGEAAIDVGGKSLVNRL